jgi:hypothetical protein
MKSRELNLTTAAAALSYHLTAAEINNLLLKFFSTKFEIFFSNFKHKLNKNFSLI